MNRRELLLRLTAAGGLLTLRPQAALAAKLALPLDSVEQLKSVGGSALLKIKGKEILFIRESEETVLVLDPTCSHRRCTVEYHAERGLIVCPCHGSTYSPAGKVLEGPASRDLKRYESSLQDGRIIFEVKD